MSYKTKLIVHDYAGHPFQADLSRSLSKQGFKVYHLYFKQDIGPKANFETDNDNANLKFIGVDISSKYSKTNFFSRVINDIEYGKNVAKIISKIEPDLILSGNTPLNSQKIISNEAQKMNIKFIFWCQDFYSIAMKKILTKKLGLFGKLIGKYYENLEKKILNNSSKIIVITRDFLHQMLSWNIKDDKIHIIENWADPRSIFPVKENNPWEEKNLGIRKKFRFLYSGTLALKYDYDSIVQLSLNKNYEVIVVGSGNLFDQLKNENNHNVKLFGLQPYEDLKYVLSSADVLLANLSEDAAEFAVPSKVLSYFCAGKPVLFSAPSNNQASRIIENNNIGLVSSPNLTKDFLENAQKLYKDRALCKQMGDNARGYALENFNLKKIAHKFTKIF